MWQVIDTLRIQEGDVEATAKYFAIAAVQVRACLAYYAEFDAEVDAQAATEAEAAQREWERFEREQRALG